VQGAGRKLPSISRSGQMSNVSTGGRKFSTQNLLKGLGQKRRTILWCS